MSLFWEYLGHIMLLVFLKWQKWPKNVYITYTYKITCILYCVHVYLFIFTYVFRCLNQAYLKWKDERSYIHLTNNKFSLAICKVLFQAPSRRITALKKTQYNGIDMHGIFRKTNENLFSQRNKSSFLWSLNWDLNFK